jgi:hypothetical protein
MRDYLGNFKSILLFFNLINLIFYLDAGFDRGIGHFMLFEVDSEARVPAPPIPRSPRTLNAASDRKSALPPPSRQAG